MKEAAIQEIFFIKKSKRKAQLSLLKTIAKEGEIKVGPGKSAFPLRETEKEVLTPEIQHSKTPDIGVPAPEKIFKGI